MKFDKEKMRLYAITDRHWLNGRSLKEVVKESLDGGVTFLQLISDLNVLRTYFFALTTFHTFIGRFPAMFAYQPFFLVNCAVASSLVL